MNIEWNSNALETGKRTIRVSRLIHNGNGGKAAIKIVFKAKSLSGHYIVKSSFKMVTSSNAFSFVSTFKNFRQTYKNPR